MAQTILLSKVFGLFLIIVSTTILLQRHDFMNAVAVFARDRLIRIVISAVELLAALFLVMMHNEWSSIPAVIITLFGWMALMESIVYLALPNRVVEPLIAAFNIPMLYVFGGVLALVLGIYLAAFGFGFIRG